MIVFGSSNNIGLNDWTIRAVEEGNLKIFNLCSMSEKGEGLFSLIPLFTSNMYDPEREKEFDLAYANYIMNEDNAFMDLMKIIYPEYANSSENIIIYIMVNFDEIRVTVIESLVKFIQQRYGINCNIIYDPMDWEAVVPSEFHITGLYNLDQDKERYSELLKDISKIPVTDGD